MTGGDHSGVTASCVNGANCVSMNAYYWQCVESTGQATVAATSVPVKATSR